MDKLIIIAMADRIGDYYCTELRNFFQDDLQVDYMTYDADDLQRIGRYDMVMITTYTLVERVKPFVSQTSRIIKVVKNLNPKGIERLKQVPYGSEALVVNVGPKTVSESIYLIYSHGRTDLELHPYYPGIEVYKKLDYVLTQGELSLVPNHEATFIDILDTIIDSRTLLEIISYFGLDKKKYLSLLIQRRGVLLDKSDGMSMVISERFMQESIINLLFENLNEGVLIFNSMGIVTSNSNSTVDLLGRASQNIMGRKITDIIPIDEAVIHDDESTEMVVKVKGTALICTLIPKMTLGTGDYGLVILKRYSDAEMKIFRYKKQLIEKGHTSKYVIGDIIGSSSIMQKIKNIATRMAGSNSTVLIMGESGTGKELFAHVIHNQSNRSRNQFVAVNCSAIPENLLESELFGYEEGAFTGARRGGKRGLFESANGGTLFLDEIGEIPLHLQNRLLRVLQEKQIMRVGGNTIIDIDVRIIAATNINLKEQVEKGKFRKDLYYRLSVLPLMIPPLRDRGEDVFEIFDALVKQQGHPMTPTDDVKNFFMEYDWDGNVREVRNCVEYLINLDKPVIDVHDLPENMVATPKTMTVKSLCGTGGNTAEGMILEIIYDRTTRHMKSGRKTILSELAKKQIYMGEQEIRNKLIKLQERGLVVISKGRGGTMITDRGISYLAVN